MHASTWSTSYYLAVIPTDFPSNSLRFSWRSNPQHAPWHSTTLLQMAEALNSTVSPSRSFVQSVGHTTLAARRRPSASGWWSHVCQNHGPALLNGRGSSSGDRKVLEIHGPQAPVGGSWKLLAMATGRPGLRALAAPARPKTKKNLLWDAVIALGIFYSYMTSQGQKKYNS